eukprot:scaffold57187_cov40-Attheya_sp.AAC.1
MTDSNNVTQSTRNANDEGTTALTAIATPPHNHTDSLTQQQHQPPSIIRTPSTNSSKKSPNKDST